MEKQILNFTVNEQILVCENPIKISTNKVNYIQAQFDLGTNWSGYDSIRAIWFNDFNCISTVLDSLGNCVVPFEVMKRKGNVKVNLVGSISEDDVLTDRLTSYPVVAVIVDCTAQITGANTSPITPSEFEQFAQRVHTDAERAEAGATASEQSATESANSASASAESAQEAEAHASSAQIYAGMASNEAEASANSASEAQTYAQSASESATDAEGYAEDAESARDTILGMRATANTLSEGSDATASYSNGLLTLGIPRGNTGAKGDKGDRGDVGATPNLSIGTVTTLDPDESATATISGTAEEPILSFGIPKGDTGEVSLQELESATVVQTLSDNTPYNYRRTNNGNGSGHREYDEIVGASVGWNQLSPIITGYGVYQGTKSVSDNVLTFTATASTTSGAQVYKSTGTPLPARHKYLSLVQIRPSKAVEIRLTYYGSTLRHVPSKVMTANVWNLYSGITETATDTIQLTFYTNVNSALSEGDTVEYKDFMVTDLTSFNTQIADYVYSLEQSTAGSGVTWLKTHFPKLFDNGYQPYDSGSIKSVSGLQSHDMRGFNAWDEEWELGVITVNTGTSADGQKAPSTTQIRSKNYMRVVGGGSYYLKYPSNTALALCLYDGSKNFIGFSRSADYGGVCTAYTSPNTVYVMPTQAVYAMFYMGSAYGTTYKNDICINLSDPSINGQYFPHEKHTYPLDSSVTLRGQYKLNDGSLYAVGDVYPSSGQIGRTWGEVDLGTLEWSRRQYGTDFYYFRAEYSDVVMGVHNTMADLVCAKYVSAKTGTANLSADKTITNFSTNNLILIRDDSYTDETAFTSAMSGTKLVYKKATPTTFTADPYTAPQWCDSHGTEEYIGSELPVGHNTQYPMTLIDTADGLSNGTYEPRITVANGKKTVTWVSV